MERERGRNAQCNIAGGLIEHMEGFCKNLLLLLLLPCMTAYHTLYSHE